MSRDATAIEGREKPLRKESRQKATPRKKGRPCTGEQREPRGQTGLERHSGQSAEEEFQELPVLCDRGTKRNSKGFKETWIGYKLQADVNDCGLPVSVAMTSASVDDSQVAIPLMKTASAKVDYLYDLMDADYDSNEGYNVSRTLGYVPIIDKNPRGSKQTIPMAPHEVARYQERTAVERFCSQLKEEFGAGNVMVLGEQKVKLHLMFGVVAVFPDQLLKLETRWMRKGPLGIHKTQQVRLTDRKKWHKTEKNFH